MDILVVAESVGGFTKEVRLCVCVYMWMCCLSVSCVYYVCEATFFQQRKCRRRQGRVRSVHNITSRGQQCHNNECKVLSIRVLCLYCLLNMRESLFMVILCVFACVVYPRAITM